MSLDELRSRLEDGLHQENLRRLLLLINELTQATQEPLALYVLASVIGDLEAKRRDQPLDTSQAEAAEGELMPALRQVVFCLQRSAPLDDLHKSLNRLISRYVELDRAGALG